MATRKQKLAAGAAALLAVGGAGGAIAATKIGTPGEENTKILDDAAKELGVTSDQLSAALKKALKNRVDEAVAAGRLTEADGKALKQRIDSSDYPLLFGGPRFFGKPGFGFGERHALGFGGFLQLDAAASYLGLTPAQLRTELRSGSTLAEVAKEKGKSVDGLVKALVAAAKEDLDAAVKAGKLTRSQADSIVEGLDERFTAIVNGERGRAGFPGPFFGFGHRVLPSPPRAEFHEDFERSSDRPI
jgi:hypothetical protein